MISRAELIRNGTWPTSQVTTDQGVIRIAKADALASLRMSEMYEKKPPDAATASMLCFTAVNDDGTPMFKSEAQATEFLGCISSESLLAITKASQALNAPKAADAGKDSAS